jgi:uncharacterized protein
MDTALLVTTGLWILAATLIVIGLAGLALPALPGAPLLFCGLVIAAWADDFAYVGTGTIVALAILSLLTYPVDILAGALGARKFGASRQAMIGAGIGALVGLVFGLAGVVLGPFIGALIGELHDDRAVPADAFQRLNSNLLRCSGQKRSEVDDQDDDT